MTKFSFGDQEMLIMRLVSARTRNKKISVIAGSGLTIANLENSELGVLSVSEIVKEIENIFRKYGALNVYNRSVASNGNFAQQYQEGMRTLLSSFGQDELNNVIQASVLASMNKKITFNSADEIDPSSLERDFNNWYLRKGVDSLGELYVDFNEIFSEPILTTNFDPLLEISIRKHGGTPQSISLAQDGQFLNHFADNIHSVVHLHGYWFGSDTLHTIDQLKRQRPLLKGDLKKLLQNSLLLVIGYGGWDDVFTNSLLELINEGNSSFDVLWCFHEKDAESINKKYPYVLENLSDAIGQRVVLYSDIDCHELFPELLKQFNSTTFQKEKVVLFADVPELSPRIEKTSVADGFMCDIPPTNLYWVGRKKELDQLNKKDFKTCFVTGFGGQGKSGLASHFIRNVIAPSSDFEFWDWRDCKEEENKFQTIIIAQIERISKGKLRASSLSSESNEDLVDLLFTLLENRKIVFVFDNVDKYIDLVKLEPVGGIQKLVREANRQKHYCLFIFTCRPRITINSPNFFEIQLQELTLADTLELLHAYSPPIKAEVLTDLAKRAHVLTGGHALWLSLIAAQAKRGLENVNNFLQAYRQSHTTVADGPTLGLARNILDVVWKSLNIKQQTLLRGMAELVTAFDEDELQNMFKPQLSLNQFNKAFNILNSLNLLVKKSQRGFKDLFELHPLVKEYVLFKFQIGERSAFIMLIVKYYEQTIIWIKPKLNADSPFSYFQKYTQKAELQINNKDFIGALSTLQEIRRDVIAAGFCEEYIRVASMLFKNIDWLKAVTQEYPYFHEQLTLFTTLETERENNVVVEENLTKYSTVIPGKSSYYLNYCSLRCYDHWFNEEFDKAIHWAEEGLNIQNKTGVAGSPSLSNNYALALRDSKTPKNIQKAIEIFLQGESLDSILNREFSDHTFQSNFFGNIGRCLWMQNDFEKAMIAYCKAYTILSREKNEKTIMNMGYACKWIAEAVLIQNDVKSAIHFLKYCFENWEISAPIRVWKTRIEFAAVLSSVENERLLATISILDTERYCTTFVTSYLEKHLLK